MSGTLTPLQLNVAAAFTQNQGLTPNANTIAYGVTYRNISTVAGWLGVIANANAAVANSVITASAYQGLSEVSSDYGPLIDYNASGNNQLTTALFEDHILQILPPTDYSRFVQTFGLSTAFVTQMNLFIGTAKTANTYLGSTFTSMDDLTTGGFSTITANTVALGTDLAACGNAINLKYLAELGRPSLVVKTLKEVANGYVGFEEQMLTQGIPRAIIDQIGNKGYVPPMSVERQIYAAMQLVTGQQLREILSVLGCRVSVTKLSEVLNLTIMLPRSWQTLKSIAGTGFQPIYQAGIALGNLVTPATAAVNTVFANAAPDLALATAPALADSNRALANAFAQVKKIEGRTTPEIASTLSRIELTTNLSNIQALTSPLPSSVSNIYSNLAQGTGANGQFRLQDVIGTIGGYGLNDQWEAVITTTQAVVNSGVANVLIDPTEGVCLVLNNIMAGTYGNNPANLGSAFGNTLPSWISGGPTYSNINAGVLSLTVDAQTAIDGINASIAVPIANGANAWANMEAKLASELAAMANAGIVLANITTGPTSVTLSWVQGIPTYVQNQDTVDLIERICDRNILGGQATIAALREARTMAALQDLGIPPDNKV